MYNVDNSEQIQNLDVKKEERVQYLDYLRVISAFAVIVIHDVSIELAEINVFSIDWALLNIFSGIARWAVPVFVMISGTLFLGREIPISKIYSKYVLRLVTAFVFWGVIYGFASRGVLEVF